MTIYLDVLIAVNLLFTYLFLVLVRVSLSIPTNKYLILLGSVLGGVSSLIVFLGDLGLAFSLFYKLAVGSVIVLVSFTPKRFKLFLKELFAFFTVTFIFGGVMLFLELTDFKKNLMYINGTVYFNISLTYLVISILIIYGVYLILNYVFTTRNLKNELFQVTVFYNNLSVTIQGFLDTGNNALEPFSNSPVFISEVKALAPIFNINQLKFFKSDLYCEAPKDMNIRLIPIKTAGGEALLKAFKPEKIVIKNKKSVAEINNVFIALTVDKLSDGDYQIILNKSILDLKWRVK